MVKVELKNLCRKFNDGTTIGPITFTIEHGELMTLLGPSGAGKTTTLRMVAGFIKPDSGDLLFDNKSVLSVPPRERGIGMVFQSSALFPNMTVFQNISFSLDVAGWNHSDVIARVEELAELLKIRNLLNRKINEISGGEAQRVALARALAREPQLLLLDEPLSALDPQLRERLQNEIKRVQRELGVTTLYVTHSQAEAFAISDRIAILNNGTVVQIGEPEKLYEQPKDEFVARFLGSGNVFEGIVQSINRGNLIVNVENHQFVIAGNAPVGSKVIFTVKPEDIRIFQGGKGGARAEIKSIVPQVGTYKARLKFNGVTVISLIEDADLVRQLRTARTAQVQFAFSPDDAVILQIK